MNVNYSDAVTNTIKTLRESVYNTEEFKSEFSSELKKSISATNTDFVAEQFGGWSVNVTMGHNDSDKIQDSKSYLSKVADALTNSIHVVSKNISSVKSINVSNLANVIVTGSDSITVKL